jgi:hypothetical protein
MSKSRFFIITDAGEITKHGNWKTIETELLNRGFSPEDTQGFIDEAESTLDGDKEGFSPFGLDGIVHCIEVDLSELSD